MKRPADDAFDSTLESTGDDKRPAVDSCSRPTAAREESMRHDSTVAASRHDSTVAASSSAASAGGIAIPLQEPSEELPDPALPLAPDGDAAAGPRPVSDYFEWELVPSPVRPAKLRRSHAISDRTWLVLDAED